MQKKKIEYKASQIIEGNVILFVPPVPLGPWYSCESALLREGNNPEVCAGIRLLNISFSANVTTCYTSGAGGGIKYYPKGFLESPRDFAFISDLKEPALCRAP